MKRYYFLSVAALTGILACLTPPASADDYDKKTVITLSAPTEAPGIILQPGTYVIKLLNSSSNRHIAEIMNERMDHLYALTFTAASERLEPTGKPVITFYEEGNGRPQAIRRWYWPGDTIGQEFLYPKGQAAKISAATHEKVPEGDLPTVAESGQSLSPDNKNGLSTETSENTTPTTTTRSTEPAVIAQNNTPAPRREEVNQQPAPAPVRDRDDVDNNRSTQSATSPATTQPSQTAANVDTSEKTLPQTASNLPLIALIGIVFLAAALLLGLLKRSPAKGL